MDLSSAYLQPYEAVTLMTLGLGLGEEEVMYEARRKRQRVGRSPPYPRSIIPPYTTSDLATVEEGRVLRPSQPQRSRGHGLSEAGTNTASPSLDRIRSSLHEALNELQAVVSKIQKLTRLLETEKQENRHGSYFSAIQRKLEELYSVLSDELGDNPSARHGKRIQTSVVPAQRRPTDDDILFTSINHHDKRKRSRRVITLNRTTETMDVDMDP